MTIRWQCDKRGCYKDNCIPDWGFLDSSFPGKNRVSDVDGVVELGGHFLFLEWKGGSAPLPNAQRWFHEAITLLSDNVTSYIIRGDVTSGDVYGVQIVRSGQVGDIIKADSNRLAEMCRRWSKKVAPNRQ